MFNIKGIIFLAILMVVVAGGLVYAFWFRDDWKGVEYAVWSKSGQTKSDLVFLMPHPDSVKYTDCWLDELYETVEGDRHDSLESLISECRKIARPDLQELLEYGRDDEKNRPQVRDRNECRIMYEGVFYSRDEHKRKILESAPLYISMEFASAFADAACTKFAQ